MKNMEGLVLEIKEKRERLIDWINQMDEKSLDGLIEEYLD